MTALWILGILLFILLTVLVSRVGAEVAFGEETRVTLRLGLIRVQVLPRKSKEKRAAPKKKAPEKAKGKKKPKKEAPKITASAVLEGFPQLWKILKKGLRMTRRRIRISPMKLWAVIGGEDPANTAILYGRLSAAMYAVVPVLQELLRMPDPQIHLEPDLQGGESRAEGEIRASFLIWDLVVMGFACGIPLIKWFLHLRRQPPQAADDTNSLTGKDEQNGKQAEDQSQRNDGDLYEQGKGDGQQ